jgi:hypothetical protein
MRKLALGIAIGLVIGSVTTGSAALLRDIYAKEGDRVGTGATTVCDVVPYGRSLPGFNCRVGGDYRAKYGVIINELWVAVTQYTGFNRYHVIWQRRQKGVA